MTATDAEEPSGRTRAVVSGTRWGAATQLITQVSRLLVAVVLARLLTRAEFGIVIYGLTFIIFFDILKDLGIAAAVVQRKTVNQRMLSSLFYVNTAVGVLLSAVFALLAPVLVAFAESGSGEPFPDDSGAILATLGLVLMITSLGMVQQGLLRRELRFDRLAVMNIAQTVVNGVVAIAAAVAGAGAWSLVVGQLSGAFVFVVLAWASTGWRPSLVFSWRSVTDVAGFSLNLTGFNILNFFFLHSDKILVGRVLGASALGIYGLGQRILYYPVQAITRTLQAVLFPTFSRIQDDHGAIARGYLRACGGIALLTFPAMIGLTVLAEPIVLEILGPRWEDAIPVIQVLAPIGLLHSLHFTVGAIYTATGRTDILLKWGIVSGVITVAAYLIGIQWGLMGLVWGYAIAVVLLTYPAFAIPFRLIDLQPRRLATTVAPYFFASLVMGAAVLGARLWLESLDVDGVIVIAVGVVLGVAIYTAWMLIQKPPAYHDLLRIITMSSAGTREPDHDPVDASTTELDGASPIGVEP